MVFFNKGDRVDVCHFVARAPRLVLDQLSMWYADGHGGRDGKKGFAGASAPKGRGTAPRIGLVATNVVRFCVEFEWDQEKAEANLRKHGVAFEDAARVFLDPNRIETFDGREDYGEDRWRTVGLVDPALLAVVYTVRGEDPEIT